MGNFSVKKKTYLKLIILSLVLILGGSIFAHMFNTSFYATTVSRTNFTTPIGELSGLLYMPKGAGREDPRPTIITTHGYLNSGEMQDAGAIELSRRGYVVLALDMYDHGHSLNKSEFEGSTSFFSFWPTSIYDAVQYMYEQDYVLKDDSGNGIIAVAGHSMGGFSSSMAMVQDEQDYATTGIRKIHAGLTMGSDYLWSSYLGVTADVAFQAYGPRIVGKIAAHYDEFFFDTAASASGKTVVYKDYVNTEDGQKFLGNPAGPQSETIYMLDNGGKRIIYTPAQIHPWNHFSKTTTANQIDFYAAAFAGYRSPNQSRASLDSSNQIWFFKELFTFVSLVGFFLLFVPLVLLLINTPLFSSAKTQTISPTPGLESAKNKAIYWIIVVISGLFPAVFFPTLMDKAGTGMTILKVFAWLVIVFSIIKLIFGYIGRDNKKIKTVVAGPMLIFTASLILLFLLSYAPNVFTLGKLFNQPTTNQILYWAMVVTAFMGIVGLLNHYLRANKNSLKQYGFVTNWKSVLSGLFAALFSVFIGYLILYLIDAVFKTDFRIWTWAVKTFRFRHLISTATYLPFFFFYFYITGITVNANTTHIKGWKGYLVACLVNVGGLVLYLVFHYGNLFLTGTALFPSQALSSILLFALVPTLTVATIYTKILFKKTGNVYAGVFLNTILVTMITVANTTLYGGLV